LILFLFVWDERIEPLILVPYKKASYRYVDAHLHNPFKSIFFSYRYLHESGAALATRALGYGTLYAFAGCGVLFFSGSLI
jgi:hypothetical protein